MMKERMKMSQIIDGKLVSKQVIGTACLGEYRTVPLFYEQQR